MRIEASVVLPERTATADKSGLTTARPLVPFILLLLAAGCVPRPLPPVASLQRPDPEIINWSGFSDNQLRQWLYEARRVLGTSQVCVFACHGCADRNGEWWIAPNEPRRAAPVESVAWMLHDAFPDRNIVLICCNPSHEEIHVPNVWTARELVWTCPGPDRRFVWDAGNGPGFLTCVGHFSEFRK